MRQLTM